MNASSGVLSQKKIDPIAHFFDLTSAGAMDLADAASGLRG
jgi:hypothetical protein